MDQEMLIEVAKQVKDLPMYPYFEIAHYTLMCMYVREDFAAGAGTTAFSRKHPFACWLSSMMTIFAGGILANFFLGENMLAPFDDEERVLLATAVWYLINYSPFDVVYKMARFAPVKLVPQLMVEVRRTHRIHLSVTRSLRKYDDFYILAVLVGTSFAAGSNIMRTAERLVRGIWSPGQNEALQPSFYTKACALTSILFIIEEQTNYITVPHVVVYLGVVVFFVYFKLSSLLLGIHDPFVPLENLFCAIFLGGMFDALRDAIASTREKAAKVDTKNGKTDKEKKRD